MTSQFTTTDSLPTSPGPLPLLPEELTAKWFSAVLNRKVRSATILRVQPGTASKVFISITFADQPSQSQPVSLCVKGGFDPVFTAQMPFITAIYHAEADFFTHVYPRLSSSASAIDLPRRWWSGKDAHQGIVVMDDLSQRSDFHSFGTAREVWPFARVLAGVEQLAALHASTWGVNASAELPWLASGLDQAVLALMETYGQVVAGADRPVIPSYLMDQDRVTAVLKKHYASRNPRFRCLVHGDPHHGNTYLVEKRETKEKSVSGKTGGDGGDDDGRKLLLPRFIDWQTILVGSAFHDVAYFIAGALDIPERRAREWEVVEHYLRCLQRLGVADAENMSCTDEDIVVEYKKSLLAGVGWIMCPYEMQPHECVWPMALRYAAALDDHGVLELVEGLSAAP